MLWRLFFTATLAALVPVRMAHAAMSADETAILKIEHGMSTAQDVDQALTSWDKNAVLDDMLTMTPKTAEYVGLAAIRADLALQFGSTTDVHIEVVKMVVKADGKVGFAYSVQHLTAKTKDNGSTIDLVFRESDCFEKKRGKWLLVHQDLSVPFDPATGKAVFDSK